MQKEIWVCIIHTFGKPSVVSSDGYSSLRAAREALLRRLSVTGYWENNFVYSDKKNLRRYELKCITIED